jgi:hypothetical protein
MVVGSPMATEKNTLDPFISFECQNFIPEGDIAGQLNFTEGLEKLPDTPCTNIKMAISTPSKLITTILVDSVSNRMPPQCAMTADMTAPITGTI